MKTNFLPVLQLALLLLLAACQGRAQTYSRAAFEREVATFRFSLYPYLTTLNRTGVQALAHTDLTLAPVVRTLVETFLASHQAAITQYQTDMLAAATVPQLPLAQYQLLHELPADSGLTAELTQRPLLLRLNSISPFAPLYSMLQGSTYFRDYSAEDIGAFYEKQQIAQPLPYAVQHSADTYTLAFDYHTVLLTAEFDRRTQQYQHIRVYRAKPRPPVVAVRPSVEALGRAVVAALVRADPRLLRPYQATPADTRQLLQSLGQPAPDSTVRRETDNFAREAEAALVAFQQSIPGMKWGTLRYERAVLAPAAAGATGLSLGPEQGQVVLTCRTGTGPPLVLELGTCFYLNQHWIAPLQGLRRR